MTAAPVGQAAVGVRLRRSAVASQLARRQLRRTCRDAGIAATVTDAAARVAGQLVGLSVRQSDSSIGFEVALSHRGIEIRVHDDVTGSPDRHGPPGVSTHGNLELVHRSCQTWGVALSESGRILWAVVAVLPLSTGTATPTYSVPGRAAPADSERRTVDVVEAISHASRHRWHRPRRTSKPDPTRICNEARYDHRPTPPSAQQ